MSRGTWPLLGDNACKWQHFPISAAIWFSTGLARNTVHSLLQPVNHCDCPLGFRSRSSFLLQMWMAKINMAARRLPTGCQSSGRRRRRCAVTLRTGEGRQTKGVLEISSSHRRHFKVHHLVLCCFRFSLFFSHTGQIHNFWRNESLEWKSDGRRA